MPKAMTPLSKHLETSVLQAILRGLVPPDVVGPNELSHVGRIVLAAATHLLQAGATPPLNLKSVWLTATEVLGADRTSLKEYLAEVAASGAGTDAATILQRVRDKQLLTELINTAGSQLTEGRLELGPLLSVLGPTSVASLTPISEALRDGLPEPPKGIPIKNLPIINEKCGSLAGVWAIAGPPEVGKSTLVWQLVLDVASEVPVLYYDFENGLPVLLHRTGTAFKGNLERIRRLTARVYYRDSIRTLETDLGAVPPPAVIAIDSIQKLPSSIEYRRTGLERWVHKLEGLKRRGYSVVIVSEIGRASYEADPFISDFKETGEIEYTADLGLRLRQRGSDVEVHIIKNRHYPHKGHITTLSRYNEWLFKENE